MRSADDRPLNWEHSLPLTRRSMMRKSVAAGAALALSRAFAPLLEGADNRGWKIGACEWSLGKSDPSCMEVAREIGLDGVQVNLGNLGNHMWLRRPDVQQSYIEAARKAGVAIGGLALGELNSIPLKSDIRASVWLSDAVDVAKALGVRVILVAQFFKGDLKDDADGTTRTVEVLQEIAPKAERLGIILGLENYLSAEENLAILERVKSPAVLVYYDVGNSTDKGYDIYREIRMLKGKVCEFHFKDAGHMLGKGRVDFGKVREAVEEIGFTGWAQIEAAAPNGLVKDYQAHLKMLRPLFPS